MALKGSATIELTNADGSKEIIKHDNMITNAVNDLLYVSRGEQSNIMRICNTGDSFIEQIFGGILLFKDKLSNDPADYLIPSVKTVGYASNSAYGGLDVERGGYNAIESGLQEDGSYKFVWDFATSQANGTIRSIALCPNMMGRIGMSNSAVYSERISSTTIRPSISPYTGNLLTKSGTTNGWSNYGFKAVAVNGNTIYALHKDNVDARGSASAGFRANGGILKLFKFDIAYDGVNLKSLVGFARYVECIDIQLPAEFISCIHTETVGMNCSYDAVNNKIILYRCYHPSNLNSNATTKYCEINLSDFNLELKTFTNNSTGYIKAEVQSSFMHDCGANTNLYILGEYIVFIAIVNGNRKLYVAKKRDNTDIKEVKFENGNEYYAPRDAFRDIFVTGNLFVIGFSQSSEYTNFTNAYVLDMSTGLIKTINVSEMTYNTNIRLESDLTFGKTGPYLNFGITVNPFVLTTKNNLDEEVTKTASQTMKITYTLTESEGA